LAPSNKKVAISVLHVDDDPSLQEITKLMLLYLNSSLEIDHACCVDEGLSKLAVGHYDVVVSDYDMPKKNGLDFLRELRQSKNMVPFILFTGKGREDVAVTALNLGAEGYFHKQGSPETVYGELVHGINFVTEKAKAKSALEASEKRYFTLMNQAAEAIFIHDEKGKILDVNQQACKNLQYTREELLSRSVKDISVIAEDAKYVREVWLKVLAGNTISLQSTQIRKDKSKFPVEVTLTTISFDKEKLVIALVRDVTERKKAEDDLKFSKQFSESVINSVGEVLLVIDVNDFRIVDANAAALKQTGCNKVELTGKTCYAMTHHKSVPCQPPNDICPVHEMIETGKPVRVEHKHFDKDNNELLVEVSVYPIRNVEGKIIQATHISRSITETKKPTESGRQNEEENKKLQEYLQLQIDRMPIGLIVWDSEFRVKTWNPSAERIFGFTQQEAFGKHPYDLIVPKEIQPQVDRIWSRLIEGDVTANSANENLTKNGRTILCEWSNTPLKKEDGTVIGALSMVQEVTERKKNEDALREKDFRFTKLASQTPGMLFQFLKRPNGTYCVPFTSDGIHDIFGCSPQDVQNDFSPITKAIVSEDLDTVVRSIEYSAANMTVWRCEYRVQLPGQEIRWMWGHSTPERLDDGSILWSGYNTDITEQKKTKLELQESEERYRSLFEQAPLPVAITALDGSIVDSNTAMQTLTGYSFEELNKTPTVNLYENPQDRKTLLETLKRDGIVSDFSTRFKRKDKIVVDVILNTSKFKIGKKSFLRTTIQDVTESKKAQNALLDSEEKYRETIENANVGIVAYQSDGKITILNPTMQKMTGYTIEEIPSLSQWFEKLYSNEVERQKIKDKWFKKLTEVGEVKEGQATIITKQGEERIFLFDGFRLQCGDLIAFARDITDRVKAEESLNVVMDQLVLVNEKLGVVGSLTRHDVRNKLSAVTGYAYLLKKKHADEVDIVDGLGKMEQAVKDALKIFEFAKLYEQLGVEELTYINVKEKINEAKTLFSGSIPMIINECHSLTVLADSFLRQLFYNFIDNTRKYGQKTTTIKVHYERTNQENLKLIYEDDGVGIPLENKNNLFKEGFSTGGSTGFGLFLTKKMIDVYGWTIVENGEPGIGAKFTLTIPKLNKSGKENYQLTQ
jgi:PAS domain S-box-containing protein